MTPTPSPSPTPVWYFPNPTGTPATPSPTPGWLGGGSFSGGGDQPGGASGGGGRGFGDDWETPTMYPTSNATPEFNLAIPVRAMPDAIVQGYNTLNQNDAFDLVWFVVIVFLLIGGVTSIYRRLQSI